MANSKDTDSKQHAHGQQHGGQQGQGDIPNPIQVQKFLKGIDYPASKDDIVQTARQHGADDNVMSALDRLPERTYDGPNGVAKELGAMS